MSDENSGIPCPCFCRITYREISHSQRDNKVVGEYFQWGVIEDAEDDENVANDRSNDQTGQQENSQHGRPEQIFFNLLLHLHPTRNFYAKVVSELPQIILYLLPQIFKKAFMQSVSISIKNT